MKVDPGWTGTDMSTPGAFHPLRTVKNSSRPSRAHRGSVPPPVEIGQRLRSTAGNGRTYTSARPDSSDWYASHRPSGEMAGVVSECAVFSNGRVSTDGPNVAIVMSSPVLGPRVSRTIRVLSGEKGLVFLSPSTLNDASAGPLPSAA